MKTIEVEVSADTFAKLQHVANGSHRTVTDVATVFISEGVTTCDFIFGAGVTTQSRDHAHASV